MVKVIFALRFLAALVVVVFCHLMGIPVGVSGQRLVRVAAASARRAARPARYEGRVDLRQARAWHAVSKVSDMNSLFANIFEDTLFVAREQNLMAMLVTPYTAQGFATRTIPIYPSLTAQTKAEGVDYANPTTWTKSSEATFTPSTKMVQVLLTDERMKTDPENAQRDATIEMGGAIGTAIDESLCALFTNFATGKGTANNALALAKVAAAISVLRNNKVRGTMSVVLHPYGWHDIWVELGQPGANQALLGDTANEALREYYVGRFLAANWYTSANIDVDASDDAISAVFVREALALDTREAPTLEPERDASRKAWELNLSASWAAGVRRDDYGVKLTHDATEPT